MQVAADAACKRFLAYTLCAAGVRRELYLCDDGKDPTKRVWLETTYGQGSHSFGKGKVHYVSGRCVPLQHLRAVFGFLTC
jgi:hypothetical protein